MINCGIFTLAVLSHVLIASSLPRSINPDFWRTLFAEKLQRGSVMDFEELSTKITEHRLLVEDAGAMNAVMGLHAMAQGPGEVAVVGPGEVAIQGGQGEGVQSKEPRRHSSICIAEATTHMARLSALNAEINANETFIQTQLATHDKVIKTQQTLVNSTTAAAEAAESRVQELESQLAEARREAEKLTGEKEKAQSMMDKMEGERRGWEGELEVVREWRGKMKGLGVKE